MKDRLQKGKVRSFPPRYSQNSILTENLTYKWTKSGAFWSVFQNRQGRLPPSPVSYASCEGGKFSKNFNTKEWKVTVLKLATHQKSAMTHYN